MAFLDCHSKIRFRALEPGVFPIQCGKRGVECVTEEQLSSEILPFDTDDVYSDHFPFQYGALVGTIKGDKGWVCNHLSQTFS